MNEDWEKEFEEKWYESFDYDGNKNLDKFGELKQFVESLLSTQRQEILQRINDFTGDSDDAYNLVIGMKDLLADLRDGNV